MRAPSRGFVDGQRHLEVQVVAFTAEQRMRGDRHGDVQVTGRPAGVAGVAVDPTGG